MSYSLAFWHSISVAAFIAIKMEHEKCEFLTTKHISETLNIPHSTVRKILKQLTMAGLIETREGAKGGVIFTRDPQNITFFDIFEALEQKRAVFKTNQVGISDERAIRIEEKVKSVFSSAELSMKSELKKVTIGDLLKE